MDPRELTLFVTATAHSLYERLPPAWRFWRRYSPSWGTRWKLWPPRPRCWRQDGGEGSRHAPYEPVNSYKYKKQNWA